MTFLALRDVTAAGGVGNDRKRFDDGALRELAENIAAHGLAQPVTVRPVPCLDGERWELVAGERRYRAHLLLDAEGRCPRGGEVGRIEVNVREYDEREASAVMLAENMARADLGPLEEAGAYASRMKRYGLTPAEVAADAGVSTFRVNERVRLLSLTPEGRKLVESTEPGALPVGHAARLAVLDANRQALALAAWAESGGTISRSGWGELVGKLEAEQSQDAMFSDADFLRVESFVLDAAKKEPTTKALRRLLGQAVGALEAAGLAPELCAEIRETYAAGRGGRALPVPR